MEQTMETVPNFSEGRDTATIQMIASCFQETENVRLLDHSADPDHNRSVFTAVGDPSALREAVIKAAGVALERIDLRKHSGQHPRMGAVDVIPFIPIRNCTMADADRTARETGEALADLYGLPVFLYERSATLPNRRNLSEIRKGEFEGMADKMKAPEWKPDFGPIAVHPTGGVTAVGARMPLIAFNVNLDTDDLQTAKSIAKTVRQSSGGFPNVKAMGVMLKERGQAQVSMNMTDYSITGLFQVFEKISEEAARLDAKVTDSEIIGLAPLKALLDCAFKCLKLERFSEEQILENRL